MKHLLAIGLLLAATISLVRAQKNEPRRDAASDREALIRLVQELNRAEARNDQEFLRRAWADEYVRVNRYGEVKNKAAVLEERRTGTMVWERVDASDFQVTVRGDTAVVTDRVRSKGRINGREIDDEARALRVFVRRAGRWEALATSWTAIPAPRQ